MHIEKPVFTKNEHKLWYQSPAKRWQEALPLGNGRIGAMVYGNPQNEVIELSEITCFSGEASGDNNQRGAAKAFYEAREAYLRKDYEAGRNLLEGFIGKRLNYGTNLPVGNLRIKDNKYPQQSKNTCHNTADSYIRSLSLDNALAEVNYTSDNGSIRRSCFVSNPHQVIVMRFVSVGGEILDLSLSLDGGLNPYRTEADSNMDLLLYGNAYESMHSDGQTGVTFHGRMRVIPKGGVLEVAGRSPATGESAPVQRELRISGTDEVLVLLAVDTDFDGLDPADKCKVHIDAASLLTYDELYDAHIKEYSPLFHRVELSLGQKPDTSLSAEALLEKIKNGADDPSFTALLFQYGRYLLISSSRENSPLPAHLQGVWNDSVASRIGWTCDMHLDINTQMNYWPAEVTNLSECHKPLFNWIENSLVPSGSITAKEAYGLNGWVAELVSNAWGFTAPYWHVNISPCPTGGVWIATHMWEHYLFTGDMEFLKNHAFPVLMKAVEFFIDYIFEDPDTGCLTSGPSISPENSFSVNGRHHTASIGPTYEIVLIRELFNEFIAACAQLGYSTKNQTRNIRLEQPQSPDSGILQLLERVTAAVGRLQPFEVGPEGELKEWNHEFEAEDPQHRHTSHLLSLFPYSQITPEQTPELANAAAKTLELRLTPPESWEDTGWARSMLMLYSARLWNGEAAYGHIQAMQRHLVNPNLMVKHPPTRGAPSFADVYELDGNTGLTSCVAEMLLQSHNGELHLLPALPKQWDSGQVKGLRARGGFEIDIAWNGGVMTEAVIHADRDAMCHIRYGGKKSSVHIAAGACCKLNGQLEHK